MMATPLALSLSLSNAFTEVGAIVAFVALLGIAVLSLLVFSQAREIRRLREWAGRAPERAADLEQRVSAEAAARAQQPAAATQAVRPVPRTTPLNARPAAAGVTTVAAAGTNPLAGAGRARSDGSGPEDGPGPGGPSAYRRAGRAGDVTAGPPGGSAGAARLGRRGDGCRRSGSGSGFARLDACDCRHGTGRAGHTGRCPHPADGLPERGSCRHTAELDAGRDCRTGGAGWSECRTGHAGGSSGHPRRSERDGARRCAVADERSANAGTGDGSGRRDGGEDVGRCESARAEPACASAGPSGAGQRAAARRGSERTGGSAGRGGEPHGVRHGCSYGCGGRRRCAQRCRRRRRRSDIATQRRGAAQGSGGAAGQALSHGAPRSVAGDGAGRRRAGRGGGGDRRGRAVVGRRQGRQLVLERNVGRCDEHGDAHERAGHDDDQVVLVGRGRGVERRARRS